MSGLSREEKEERRRRSSLAITAGWPVFEVWVNSQLAVLQRPPVSHLVDDMRSGVMLGWLVEALQSKQLQINANARTEAECLQNLTVAMNAAAINTTKVRPEHLYQGNAPKLLLFLSLMMLKYGPPKYVKRLKDSVVDKAHRYRVPEACFEPPPPPLTPHEEEDGYEVPSSLPIVRMFMSPTSGNPIWEANTRRLETLLLAKKYPFETIDVTDDPEALEILAQLSDCKNLPQLIFDDTFVGDYDDVQLLEDDGLLDKLYSREIHLGHLRDGAEMLVVRYNTQLLAQKGSSNSGSKGEFEELALDGVHMEGYLLRPVGTILAQGDAIFIWNRTKDNRTCEMSRKRAYRILNIDVGAVIACEVYNRSGKVGEIKTEEIRPAVPRVLKLTCRGGPHYTTPLSLEANCTPENGVRRAIQWYRLLEEGVILPIPGANKLQYQPTCDDFGRRIVVDVTPFRNDDDTQGLTYRLYIPPAYLDMDPTVKTAVENNVMAKETWFAMTILGTDSRYPARSLVTTPKNLKFKSKDRNTIHKTNWDAGIEVDIDLFHSTHLRLRMGKNIYILDCEDSVRRDIFVLTVRSFVEAAGGRKQ